MAFIVGFSRIFYADRRKNLTTDGTRMTLIGEKPNTFETRRNGGTGKIKNLTADQRGLSGSEMASTRRYPSPKGETA
jgi:hypothetical protein